MEWKESLSRKRKELEARVFRLRCETMAGRASLTEAKVPMEFALPQPLDFDKYEKGKWMKGRASV